MKVDFMVQIFHKCAKFACLGLEAGVSRVFKRGRFNMAIKTVACQFNPLGWQIN